MKHDSVRDLYVIYLGVAIAAIEIVLIVLMLRRLPGRPWKGTAE